MNRSQPGTDHSNAERRILLGVLIAVDGLPLFWGGNRTAVQAIFGVILSTLALCWSYKRHRWCQSAFRWTPLQRRSLWLWGIWLAWIGIQLLPLPISWLQVLSPAAAGIYRAARPWTGSDWGHLSIAPGPGVQGLLLSCDYLLLWLLVGATCQGRRARRMLLWALFLGGVLQAGYGGFMVLSGIERGTLGLPKHYDLGTATGTFVNRNHFAAYLVTAMAAGIALMLDSGRAAAAGGGRGWMRPAVDWLLGPKPVIRACLLLLVVAVVLTRSRMGNAAMVTALAASGLLWALRPGTRRRRILTLAFFASFLVMDLFIVSRYFGLARVVERLGDTRWSAEARPVVWTDVLPLISEYFPWGAGLNAFAAAFAPHNVPAFYGRILHAHDEYAEFLVEAGIGALPLVALLVWTLWHASKLVLRHRRHDGAGLGFAVVMASAALLIHNAVEFNLHISGITTSWLALLGACGAASTTRRLTVDGEVENGGAQ